MKNKSKYIKIKTTILEADFETAKQQSFKRGFEAGRADGIRSVEFSQRHQDRESMMKLLNAIGQTQQQFAVTLTEARMLGGVIMKMTDEVENYGSKAKG